MTVSRETPDPPDIARRVFGSALPGAARYAELLADAGVVRGLLGPREAPRLWERHLVNCALLAEGLPLDSRVADIGSGAGLPGVVLALCRADLQVTLIEPLQRRTDFLHEVVEELGVRADVVRARAEELHATDRFDAVVSRAVAPLPKLLGWCLPLVRPGGQVLAMKGASADQELLGAQKLLGRLRARGEAGAAEVVRFGVGHVDPPTTAIRVARPSGRD